MAGDSLGNLPSHSGLPVMDLETLHRISPWLPTSPSAMKLAIIMAGLFSESLLIALDTTIIATSIPRITEEFRSLDDVAWYGSAYLLTVTAFQPSYGKIYKHFSAKWTFLTAIAIFVAGSVVCAAAQHSPVFIVGRAIAGLGAAGVPQGALCIVGTSVPLRKKPIYISIVVGVFAVSSIFGLLLGGAIADNWSWRGCFWINLPLGAVTVAAIALLFDVEELTEKIIPLRQKLEALDFPGAALLISAVICLLLPLQWGGDTYPWTSSKIIGLFVGFGISLVFGAQQWYVKDNATIPSLSVSTFWIFLMIGIVLYAVGAALMSTFTVNSPAWQWAGSQIIAGIGSGMGIQIPMIAVQVKLSKHDITTGNTILMFFGQLGGTLGVSLGQTIFRNELTKELPRYMDVITIEMVKNVGPAGLRLLAEPGPLLDGLITAFCIAIMKTFILPVACNEAALIFASFMEKGSVNKEAKK